MTVLTPSEIALDLLSLLDFYFPLGIHLPSYDMELI